MTLGSFGVEMEWGDNIAPLLRRLHEQGLLADAEMHRWHCECDTCAKRFDAPYPLIAQTDSSCAGEIITQPFRDWDEAAPVIQAVQHAAFEVDAVPGWSAGLHVHVSRPRVHYLEVLGLWEWVRWEPVLAYLASGLWPAVRDGNFRLRQEVSISALTMNIETWADFERCTPTVEALDALWEHVVDLDRHGFLNLATRHRTHEVRVFNSTRMAWRVEMAVQLSRLWFGSAEFLDSLATRTPRTDNLVTAASDAGDMRLAELLARQVEYLPNAKRPESFDRVA